MENTLTTKKDYIVNFLKGLFSSLCLSLILILVFAFVLKFVSVSDTTIKIFNQIIKISSIFYGIYIYYKKDNNSIFFKSIILGVMYVKYKGALHQ